MPTQQALPVRGGPSISRRLPAGQRNGLVWLTVALVIIVGVVGSVVWWAVRRPPLDNAYSQSHVCPAVLRGRANDDYADVFFWNGVSYMLAARRVVPASRLGPQVTTIDCNINDLTAHGVHVDPGASWPDGTATGLPSGTPVFRLDQVRTTCQLAVRVDGRVSVYQPMDTAERRC
jgi:hypothetical protein